MLASMSVAGAPTKSGAETSLLGIHLYDSAMKVISVYGTPNDIQPVMLGGIGTTAGGGAPGAFGRGGAGGPVGGPMGPAGMGGRGLPPAGAGVPSPPGARSDYTGFDFGDSLLQQGMGFSPMQKNPGAGTGGPNTGRPGGMGGMGVPSPPGGAMGPGGRVPGGVPGAGGAGMGMTGQAENKVVFTRWIYNRAGSKYGFVIDKFGRVVQIEAIGISNPRVHTARGIAFGSSFAQIIKRYNRNPDGTTNAPDGYEISGDTLVVRYLVKNKVAFRLSRLGKDKPQVVTGIAVAAGKL